jgi:hypothetical protein
MTGNQTQFHIRMALRSMEQGHSVMDEADNCLKNLDLINFRNQIQLAEKHGKSAEFHIQKLIFAHQQAETAKM